MLDVHVQGHEWSIFDGERTRWRMPAAGSSLPASETASPWRNWIVETRDAVGTLVKQEEATSLTAAPEAVIIESVPRGPGRLAQRTRGGVSTVFGYPDLADPLSTPTATITPAAAPGPPSGLLGRAESRSGSRTIVGTEITRDEGQRVDVQRDRAMP